MLPWLTEHKILEGFREGKFDNLPGKGKPFVWEDNPFEKEDMRIANHLLRQNDVLPKWLELKKEIEQEILILRQMYQETHKNPLNDKIQEQIIRLNRKIMDYNLQVPLPSMQRPLIRIEQFLWDMTCMV